MSADMVKAQQLAAHEGFPLAKAAILIRAANARNVDFWPEPELETSGLKYIDTNIVKYGGWLAGFSTAVSDMVQFPRNTAFAHLLGILSVATSYKMRYKYGREAKACNLFMITAQPPSSGKSGVHDTYMAPIFEAFSDVNKTLSANRAGIISKIKTVKEQIKNTKDDVLDLHAELVELEEELSKNGSVTPALADATAEAAEVIAARQNGYVCIASAEADGINSLLGNTYNAGAANNGVILCMFDTEHLSSARVTRAGFFGRIYGSFVVMAQPEGIRLILEEGVKGRGVSERPLLLMERVIMGERNHQKKQPISDEDFNRYRQLIHNVIKEDEEQILTFSSDAIYELNEFRNEIEPHLGDGGKYSSVILRGAIGKADKQIYKLASLLHIAENWDGTHPKRALTITRETILRAIAMYREFMRTYISAADSLGFFGSATEIQTVGEALERLAQRGTYKTNFRKLRDAVKNSAAFSGASKLTEKLRNEIMPQIELSNFAVAIDNDIYINPKLR